MKSDSPFKTEEELEAELEESTKEELVENIKKMNKATKALPSFRYTKMVLLLFSMALYLGLMMFFTRNDTPYGVFLVGWCVFQLFLLGDSFVTIYNLVQRSRGHKQ